MFRQCSNRKKIRGKLEEKDVAEAKELLSLVGLNKSMEKYPKQLSGGMRQRLALARTLFANPDVVLMDEPLSALDSCTRNKMQNLIVEQHQKSNNTIIMVTHSKEEAKKMCDVIIEF